MKSFSKKYEAVLSEYKIYALHGFLGRGNDWKLLENIFPREKIHALDLFSVPDNSPIRGLQRWAKAFNDSIGIFEKRILIGYSLGGRLALHSLIDNSSQWSAAILISTSPGLKTEKERKQRLAADKKWGEKFLSDPWKKVIEEWNSQTVFNEDRLHFDRKEKDFSRIHLATALEDWSLGMQEDLSTQLSALQQPILWIAGSNDKKYSEIAKNITLSNPLSKIWIVPEAGHRLVWQQSKLFLDQVKIFLSEVL